MSASVGNALLPVGAPLMLCWVHQSDLWLLCCRKRAQYRKIRPFQGLKLKYSCFLPTPWLVGPPVGAYYVIVKTSPMVRWQLYYY